LKSSEKETSVQPESAPSDAHAGLQSEEDAREGEAVVEKTTNEGGKEENGASVASAKAAKQTSAATLVAVDDANIPEESHASEESPRSWKLTWPSREQLIQWAPFVGIVLLGAILRFWGLGDKP
jgi:hypothetical protein